MTRPVDAVLRLKSAVDRQKAVQDAARLEADRIAQEREQGRPEAQEPGRTEQ